MKPINNTVDDLFQPRELAEDEYLNQADGLIYCSKCHTPRQHHIELKERVFLPTVRCRCQQEEYDKEEAERKHQEFLMQVSRLKANGLQDKSLHDYNFSNDKGYSPSTVCTKPFSIRPLMIFISHSFSQFASSLPGIPVSGAKERFRITSVSTLDS